MDGEDAIPDWSVGSSGPTAGGHGASELPVNDAGRWTHAKIVSIDLADFAFDAGAAVKPGHKLATTWAGIKSAK